MKALEIPGFISERQLLKLQEWFASVPDGEKVVEIGSYMGRSSSAIADVIGKNSKLICVDDFRLPIKSDAWERNKLPEYDGPMSGADAFWYNLSDYQNIELIQGISPKVFENWPLEPWAVFIDEDHFNPSVHDNIRFWWDRIKRNGFLCGHDYEELDYRGLPMDVVPEVQELVKEHNLHLVVAANMWFIQKTE